LTHHFQDDITDSQRMTDNIIVQQELIYRAHKENTRLFQLC